MGYSKQIMKDLAATAEILVKARGYQVKNVQKNDISVDVIVTAPKSKDRVLIRIVTEPHLTSGRIGKQLAHEMEEQLEEDFDRGILIGKNFTKGAMSILEQGDLEFISEDGSVLNLTDTLELFQRIQVSVDNLCKTICGKIPKSESACKGYDPEPGKCPTCKGTGRVKRKGREQVCSDCKGRMVKPSYTCDVRLISDNADFHFEKGWIRLLQHDLEKLLEIQSRHISRPKLAKKIIDVTS